MAWTDSRTVLSSSPPASFSEQRHSAGTAATQRQSVATGIDGGHPGDSWSTIFTRTDFPPAAAYLLGFLIACLSIIGGAKMATVLMVMALPILDAIWQMVNRILTGRSPFRGDRGHAHHRLLDLGFSNARLFWATISSARASVP